MKERLEEILWNYTIGELSFDETIKVLVKPNLDILNWAKSELSQESNPKLGKTMNPYRTEKLKFLRTLIDKIDESN